MLKLIVSCFLFRILVMEDQSYLDLLQSDVGLNDLHWTEEEHIDMNTSRWVSNGIYKIFLKYRIWEMI